MAVGDPPFGGHDEQGPPVRSAEHQSERRPVLAQFDALQDLAAVGDADDRVRVGGADPYRAVGVEADAVRAETLCEHRDMTIAEAGYRPCLASSVRLKAMFLGVTDGSAVRQPAGSTRSPRPPAAPTRSGSRGGSPPPPAHQRHGHDLLHRGPSRRLRLQELWQPTGLSLHVTLRHLPPQGGVPKKILAAMWDIDRAAGIVLALVPPILAAAQLEGRHARLSDAVRTSRFR